MTRQWDKNVVKFARERKKGYGTVLTKVWQKFPSGFHLGCDRNFSEIVEVSTSVRDQWKFSVGGQRGARSNLR